MNGRRLSIGLRAALAIVAVTLFVTSTRAQAPWETVVYSFNGTDGENPYVGLVMDARGNLYGTAQATVFELAYKLCGGWTYTVLHNFSGDADGNDPIGGLIFGAPGNLHGTTMWGGAYQFGTVFQLRQHTGGSWTEKVLYSFGGNGYNDPNGDFPEAGLIRDAAGNLYGTTAQGGAYSYRGTVFELSPEAGGGWIHKVLYSFTGGTDGSSPSARLVFDAAGNLYGTTDETVFELSPEAGGGWTEKTLYTFCSLTNCADGYGPNGSVIFDTAGDLYGTAVWGGTYNNGTVFELSPNADRSWTYKVLHSFNPGDYPPLLLLAA